MANIMVVEDDPQVRWALRENLSDLGHLVHPAEDGSDALQLLQRLSQRGAVPDLVVTDFSMPVMTGVDLILACQADPSLARVPFLLCSGDMDVCAHARTLGVPFYSKYDRFQFLVEKVNKILGGEPC